MKKTEKKLSALLALLMFTALLLNAGPATALLDLFKSHNGTGQTGNPPGTITESIQSDDAFKKNAKKFADIPYNDTTLEFEIMLPSDWENMSAATDIANDSADLNRKLLGKIGYYQGPVIGSSRPFVNIYAVELEHEITAKEWLENYVLSGGYALQSPAEAPSAKNARASYVIFMGLLAFDVTAKVMIHGNTAILVQAGVPLNFKKALAFPQKKIVDSFRMSSPKEGGIEDMKSFTILDALKFNYPASWTIVAPDFKDPLRLTVQLQNRNIAKKIDGVVQFLAVARGADTNIKLEISRLNEHIKLYHKVFVRKMISTGSAPVYSRFVFSRQEVYSISLTEEGSAEQELWLAALGDREWYTFVYLITPTRTSSPYNWARNIRAFDLIVQSLK